MSVPHRPRATRITDGDDPLLARLGPLTLPNEGRWDRDGRDPASPLYQRCLECYLAGRISRRGELLITCGVCRVLHHEACYWAMVPGHERLYFDSLLAEDFEDAEPGPYLFLCRACRDYRRRALTTSPMRAPDRSSRCRS